MTLVQLHLKAALVVVAVALCSIIGLPAHAGTADPATGPSDVAPASQVVATITAEYVGPGVGSGASFAAAATPTITCNFSYDYPHISSYSQKTTINAHLVGSCSAPVTTLLVRSTMCTANRDRCGALDLGTSSGKSTVSTGADLACGSNFRYYQAHGDWSVLWPPGYVPITPQSGDLVSAESPVRFKKNANGICVKES